MEKEIVKNVPVLFQTLKNYNIDDSRFSKVKIWLMHLGENLNGSVFTKGAVEQAIHTLANTPIMGYFNSNSNDFEGHEIDLIEDEHGLRLKNKTVPYGVIPEFNNAQFEDRVGDDGVTRTYLTVEGLLWNKWEDAVDVINSKGGLTGQSMEITDFDGTFTNEGMFEFTRFKFDGACLLGDAVEPAMKNSTVEVAFSNKTSETIIQEKLAAFAKSIGEGGTILEENKVDDKFEEENTEEAPVEPDTKEEPDETEPPVEPIPDETEEVDPEPEPEPEPEPDPEPVITTKQESVIENSVPFDTERRETQELPKGEEKVEVEGVDGFDTVQYEITLHDGVEHSRSELSRETTPPVTEVILVGIAEEDDEVIIKEEELNKARQKSKEDAALAEPPLTRITIGENVYTVEEAAEIMEKYFSLIEKLHKEEIDALFSEHAESLSDDELASIKEDAYSKSKEEVETAIYAVIGRKAFSNKSEKPAKNLFSAVKVNKDNTVSEPYGGILSKYKK